MTSPDQGGSPTQRANRAFDRIEQVDRPEIWITLRTRRDVVADAEAVEQRLAHGDRLPLAGLLVGVKDNIDVAGLDTTAACPDYRYRPDRSATTVRRLTDTGAIVVGKTNMDQFATGLVGTRTPYGVVRSAHHPELIAGGSSAGSAVAVALGLVDIALGTDTAGSGRVPAAFNGVFGLKPTLGLVPTTGVVPACIDWDAVTVFAANLPAGVEAMRQLCGPDPQDPRSRTWPDFIPLSAPRWPRVAIPADRNLSELTPSYRASLEASIERAHRLGGDVVEVDIEPLLDAARLLYDGALVAQRYAAVGAFLETRPASADPVVSSIILGASRPAAAQLVQDLDTVTKAKAIARRLLEGVDALLLPVTTEHPTLDDVAADPVVVNRRLGTFTNFCNILDMAAVAFPAGTTADGLDFGAMFVVPAFADQVAIDLAARMTEGPDPGCVVAPGTDLAVFGAHMSDQPLNHELQALGARYLEAIHTSDAYRLMALDTTPPKPGLVRHGAGLGASIEGELWRLSPGSLGRFLAALPPPMSLTPVELADGRLVVGFGCSQDAVGPAVDITDHGGWRSFLGGSNRTDSLSLGRHS